MNRTIESGCAGCRGHLALVSVIAALSAVAPARVAAQQIFGVVTDTAGIAVAGVEVVVEQTSLVAMTNLRGEFRLSQSPRPPIRVRARRLGFEPVSVQLTSERQFASLSFRLKPVAQPLQPVIIRPERLVYGGRLGEYYTRLERRSSGVFITRNEIERSHARNLAFLLERVPGLQLMRSRVGSTVLRFRGKTCRPLVWVDGMPMPSGDVDMNSFASNTLHGIELYFGFASVPAKYIGLRDGATCGTILLWSRGADTESRMEATSPRDLELLADRTGAFTALNVDTVAAPSGDQRLRVPYPPSLFAERLRGRVVAEFIVNPQGQIESHMIGIVSTTHPLFAEAVKSTLVGAAYSPAVKGGRKVYQLVQQPFDFDPLKHD